MRRGMALFTETFVYILTALLFFAFIFYATLFGGDTQTQEIEEAYRSGEAKMMLTGLLRTTADDFNTDKSCLGKKEHYTIGDLITMLEVSNDAQRPLTNPDFHFQVRQALEGYCQGPCTWTLTLERGSFNRTFKQDNNLPRPEPSEWDIVRRASTSIPTCDGQMREVVFKVFENE